MTSHSPFFSDDKSGLCQGKRQGLGYKEQGSLAVSFLTPLKKHSLAGVGSLQFYTCFLNHLLDT